MYAQVVSSLVLKTGQFRKFLKLAKGEFPVRLGKQEILKYNLSRNPGCFMNEITDDVNVFISVALVFSTR